MSISYILYSIYIRWSLFSISISLLIFTTYLHLHLFLLFLTLHLCVRVYAFIYVCVSQSLTLCVPLSLSHTRDVSTPRSAHISVHDMLRKAYRAHQIPCIPGDDFCCKFSFWPWHTKSLLAAEVSLKDIDSRLISRLIGPKGTRLSAVPCSHPLGLH